MGACSSPPPRTLLIRAGRVFDGTQGPIHENVRIRIEDGLIVALEPDTGDLPSLPEDGAILDARKLTVMPGLIDTYAHLTASGACSPGVGTGAARVARNLYAALASGVTTVADVATPPADGVGIRRWVGTARHRGPRVFVAGPMLTAPKGYLTDRADGTFLQAGSVIPIRSKEKAVAVVQQSIMADVDFVHVALQDINVNGQPMPPLEPDVLCAVVQEAHRQELRVLAHAATNKGYADALQCGVDGLTRGGIEPLSPQILQKAALARIPISSSLYVFAAPLLAPEGIAELLENDQAKRVLDGSLVRDWQSYAHASKNGGAWLPDGWTRGMSRAFAQQVSHAAQENLRQLSRLRVPMAFGTGAASCLNILGMPHWELKKLVASGLSASDALRAATLGSARMLDLHDALGKIVVGYRADLIAVAGKPDMNIDDMANVHHVIIDGVEQLPRRPGWLATLSLATRVFWTRWAR